MLWTEFEAVLCKGVRTASRPQPGIGSLTVKVDGSRMALQALSAVAARENVVSFPDALPYALQAQYCTVLYLGRALASKHVLESCNVLYGKYAALLYCRWVQYSWQGALDTIKDKLKNGNVVVVADPVVYALGLYAAIACHCSAKPEPETLIEVSERSPRIMHSISGNRNVRDLQAWGSGLKEQFHLASCVPARMGQLAVLPGFAKDTLTELPKAGVALAIFLLNSRSPAPTCQAPAA